MSRGEASVLFAAIAGRDRAGLLELRRRTPRGMRQVFIPAAEPERAVTAALNYGRVTDVYVGAAPRIAERGTADAVARTWVLWVDLDERDAILWAEGFKPAPSLVIESGGGRHLWWALSEPLDARWIAAANRRLAYELRGDMKATDAARILRVPGTLSHKYDPPRPVRLVDGSLAYYTARQVVGHLPDPPKPEPRPVELHAAPDRDGDPLLAIPASEYVPLLTGRDVGRDGKARCPLHEDRTPSLHAYPDPSRGWTCFGCGAGGTIYDLAARLYGIEPRGRGFHDLRRRLADELLPHYRQVAA